MDCGLQNVKNRETMRAGGWNVDGAPDQALIWGKALCLEPDTFWGYLHARPVGRVSATFKGSGRATLDFGNCFKVGRTQVFLNGKRIGSANKKEVSRIVQFDYNSGNTLMLTEEGEGIIKINSLKLAGCEEDQNGRFSIELK